MVAIPFHRLFVLPCRFENRVLERKDGRTDWNHSASFVNSLWAKLVTPSFSSFTPSSPASCPHSPPKCGPIWSAHCPGLPLWPRVTDHCHWCSFSSHTCLDAPYSHQLNVILKFFSLFWIKDLSYRVHFPFPITPKYKSFLSQFPVLKDPPFSLSGLHPSWPVTCHWKPLPREAIKASPETKPLLHLYTACSDKPMIPPFSLENSHWFFSAETIKPFYHKVNNAFPFIFQSHLQLVTSLNKCFPSSTLFLVLLFTFPECPSLSGKALSTVNFIWSCWSLSQHLLESAELSNYWGWKAPIVRLLS